MRRARKAFHTNLRGETDSGKTVELQKSIRVELQKSIRDETIDVKVEEKTERHIAQSHLISWK